ncbi:MHS family shikimate/dehydroshikimate transporter-like MFS transporter [Bradyrhizobium diazoefficiens]
MLPTYQQIGIAAPLLLIGLRFLQGIGLGGEWGGAVLMVVENCPTHRRGLLGSMVQVGNPIGNLAAIGMFALVASLPESDFMAYGWRIPFLISILLVGVGLYIRLNMEETAAFRQVQAKKDVASMPLVEIFRHHRRPFFTAVGLKISEIAYASIGGVFVMSYATANLGLSRTVVLNGAFAASLVALLAIPLFGWLSDLVGRKTMFYASCLFSALFAFPLFWLLNTRDPAVVICTIVVAITFGQMVMFGIGAPWYSELFSARLRYSGASLGFQVGAALSGGLTPLIAASLMAWSGGATWPVSLLLIACAAITATATTFAPEMANKELMIPRRAAAGGAPTPLTRICHARHHQRRLGADDNAALLDRRGALPPSRPACVPADARSGNDHARRRPGDRGRPLHDRQRGGFLFAQAGRRPAGHPVRARDAGRAQA